MTNPSDVKREIFWYTFAKPAPAKPLESDISVDAVVIGAGMAGLTTARHLVKKGLKVAILEKEFAGGGASGRSSGFITPDSELEFSDLVSRFGDADAVRLWDYALGGCEEMRTVIQEHAINCDYQEQDSLFIANTKKAFVEIKKEYEAMSKHYKGNWLYDQEKISTVIGSKDYAGGVRYDRTFGINGYLYCQGLARQLEKMGVKIYEGTSVQHIGDGIVKANDHTISAKHIVVCTDRFMPALGIYPDVVYNAQTFLTISKPLTDAQVKQFFPQGKLMVWDSDLIYQYFRMTGDNRLLFGAASLLYTYLPTENPNGMTRILNKIKAYQKKKFGAENIEVEYFWPGLIGVTKDFLPIVGEHSKRKGIYYVSGAAGLPWAAASGKYIAEKITNGRTDLDKFFSADRHFPIPVPVQKALTKPAAFALSHGVVKYFRL
jgi:gamma-glutamylputrescine oxidase